MKQAKEYKWLIEVSESYSEFADTFTSWKSLTGFFATVGTIAINLVIVWFGAKSAYDLAKDFITNINFGALSLDNFIYILKLLVQFWTYYVPIIFSFLILPFQAKRFLFIGAGNVYQAENKVFEILGRNKKIEFPSDLFLCLLYITIIPILITVAIICFLVFRFSGHTIMEWLIVIMIFTPLYIPGIFDGFLIRSFWKERKLNQKV